MFFILLYDELCLHRRLQRPLCHTEESWTDVSHLGGRGKRGSLTIPTDHRGWWTNWRVKALWGQRLETNLSRCCLPLLKTDLLSQFCTESFSCKLCHQKGTGLAVCWAWQTQPRSPCWNLSILSPQRLPSTWRRKAEMDVQTCPLFSCYHTTDFHRLLLWVTNGSF